MASDTRPSVEYNQARGSRFKFKSSEPAKRTHDIHDDDGPSYGSEKKARRSSKSIPHIPRRRSRRKESARRYHKPLDENPGACDDSSLDSARTENHTSLDTAFQESLFDALADDEGASFWEGVYGQPIHVYPNVKPSMDGKLEQMNDEEYAEYVRGRMWEKSHQHIMEEREKREAQRKAKRQQEEQDWKDEKAWRQRNDQGTREDLNTKISDSLRRGEERLARRRWQEAWARYSSTWETFIGTIEDRAKQEDSLATQNARDIIPWPTESSSWKDLQMVDVEEFFQKAVPLTADFNGVLKVERVKWHPDKMQQRFGAARLDEETVKAITAVFQSIDHLWTATKDRN